MAQDSNIHKRGFASLSPERKREIASLGGKAAHKAGTAHQFTSAEARVAGAKGGRVTTQIKAAKRDMARLAGTLDERQVTGELTTRG